MNYIAIAKTVTSTVVAIGTTKIINTIVRNNVAPGTLTDKVTVTAGSAVLGFMVADAAKKYTDATIDQLVAIAHGVNTK